MHKGSPAEGAKPTEVEVGARASTSVVKSRTGGEGWEGRKRAGGHHWTVSGEGAHQGLDSRSGGASLLRGSKAQSTGIPGVKVQ